MGARSQTVRGDSQAGDGTTKARSACRGAERAVQAGDVWPGLTFEDLFEAAPEGMVLVNGSGCIVLVNSETERLFGYEREELLGQPVEVLVPARFRERHARQRSAHFLGPHPRLSAAGLELVGLHKDGSEFPVEVLLRPLRPGGHEQLTLSTVRDISEREQLQRELVYLSAIVKSSEDAIVGRARDGTIVSWNTAAERLYGFSEEEMLGQQAWLAPPSREEELARTVERAMAGERGINCETVQVRKDGTGVNVSLTVSAVRDRHGQLAGTAMIARDISAMVSYREQLQYLADHDALTEVLNRRGFQRALSEQVERAKRYGERAALLVLDIDSFKLLNDTYGHRAGDNALREVARTLCKRLRKTDVVARLGGDEFAVLLPYAGEQEAQAVVEDLRSALCGLVLDFEGRARASVRVSVGAAVLGRSTQSDEDVLAAADRAMYRAKLLARKAGALAAEALEMVPSAQRAPT
ncbi:MAG: sensor domain-containing diguanylate cyclase [Acidimicrobiales bacterium]